MYQLFWIWLYLVASFTGLLIWNTQINSNPSDSHCTNLDTLGIPRNSLVSFETWESSESLLRASERSWETLRVHERFWVRVLWGPVRARASEGQWGWGPVRASEGEGQWGRGPVRAPENPWETLGSVESLWSYWINLMKLTKTNRTNLKWNITEDFSPKALVVVERLLELLG